MDRLRRFMIGRYGTDKLNFVAMATAFVLSIIGMLTDIYLFAIISYFILGVVIYRTLSKNIYKRVEENRKFLALYTPLETRINSTFRILKGEKYHKYFRCTSCKQEVRVPRGKGKVEITCPRCKNRFIKKT